MSVWSPTCKDTPGEGPAAARSACSASSACCAFNTRFSAWCCSHAPRPGLPARTESECATQPTGAAATPRGPCVRSFSVVGLGVVGLGVVGLGV
eukprot:6285476-Pyramimonas_sp.AAC.1